VTHGSKRKMGDEAQESYLQQQQILLPLLKAKEGSSFLHFEHFLCFQ
jgi:hypothetical protein